MVPVIIGREKLYLAGWYFLLTLPLLCFKLVIAHALSTNSEGCPVKTESFNARNSHENHSKCQQVQELNSKAREGSIAGWQAAGVEIDWKPTPINQKLCNHNSRLTAANNPTESDDSREAALVYSLPPNAF